MYICYILLRFKKKSYAKTANLLTGKTEATEEEQAKAKEGIKHEIFSHWHPNITVNIVVDYTNWAPGQVTNSAKSMTGHLHLKTLKRIGLRVYSQTNIC